MRSQSLTRPLTALVLAATYLALGQLVQSLAIPPGHAVAVFPSAGVALGGLVMLGVRSWPAVFAGAFAHHLLGSAALAEATVPLRVLLAMSLSMGATLQAVLGAHIIRKHVGGSPTLDSPRAILLFFLIGGPLACLVSASWGVATHAAAGTLDQALLSWSTWWTADVVGVILFSPAPLALFGRPRDAWRRRIRTSAAPLLFGGAASLTVFFYVSAREQRSIELEFQRRSDAATRSVAGALEDHAEVVQSIASLYAASDNVTREEFRDFVEFDLASDPSIHALQWVPRIPAEARQAFESEVEKTENRPFRIRRWGGESTWVTDDREWSDWYYPALFVEPAGPEAPAFGRDLASHAGLQSALQVARDTGRTAATPPLRFDDDQGEGYVLFQPVYVGSRVPATVEQRRANLEGFALGAFRIDGKLHEAVSADSMSGIQVDVHDVSGGIAPFADRIVFESPEGASTHLLPGLERRVQVQVAGRVWAFHFRATDDFPVGNRWQPFALLACGLLYTGLLGGFLLLVTGQTAKMRTTAAELERMNSELDEFASIASHDLKAPLRAIDHLAEWIHEDAGEVLPDGARENLATLRQRVARMWRLLDDLLEFSRVGRSQARVETIVLSELIDDIRHLLDLPSGFVVLTTGPRIQFRSHRSPLELILRNLVGNAIKHHDRDDGLVRVFGHRRGEWLEISVADDGPGIPAKHQERVFKMFKTLRPRGEVEGSGVGLAVVKKLVESYGGRTTVESDGVRGTVITFRWPAHLATDTDSSRAPLPRAPEHPAGSAESAGTLLSASAPSPPEHDAADAT